MNGILFLGLTIFFSSAVALILKAASQRETHIWQLIGLNYLVCTLAVLIWDGWRSAAGNSNLVWGLSVFVGVMYVLSLWVFHRAIDAQGLAISTTLMRLSSALPTLGSLLIFRESTRSLQIIGILLAFLILPLASREPLRLKSQRQEASRGIWWGLLLFALYGITDFTFKVQAELAPGADPQGFMIGIFGTALLLTLPGLISGPRLNRSTLLGGLFLGTANMLATYVWIRTLAVLPGSAAYPTLGLGVIAVSTLAAVVIWKEELRPVNMAFLALAAGAILMINW